ncbi:MAG: sigma-70 family RNA polymerase sigma factor [Bryobacterales bacterium]|nr:sigma-70 family RNA polymerase sigma factor [Bryobacterales bacterium]
MTLAGDVTLLLRNLEFGDTSAVERLTSLVYDELRRLAGGILRRERPGHTLQATALVHEAYMKLVGQTKVSWQSRSHFLAIAARLMRQILVDHSRIHNAAKRGNGAPKVALEEALARADERPMEIIALDDALKTLQQLDPRKAKVVELKYFGGLTGEEIAEVLEISTATVARELRMAQAWLARELKQQ